MAEIFKELTLDVFAANRIKAIVAKQYDYKSRHLLIRLTDGGNNIDVESSSTVTVNAFRPNGESAAFLGSAEQDGRVIVPLAYWMLELEGTVKCDVSIVDTDGRKLSTTNFQIEVEHANYSGDDIEPDEHYDLLVELLAEVAQAQEAENARVAAETARVTAENGRVSAETARDTAETARASAETARDTAEGARSSAETARGTAETARASAEATRQLNEASRVSAEAARAAAETAREEAEEAREQALLDYAKKDGFYEGLTAGLAENLTPYSEDSGITQTQPFFLEGTGTGNGESIADVGSYLQLKEKRGNMVCVNQLAKELSNTNWYASAAVSVSFSDNVATFTASVQGGSIYSSIPLIQGHRYYICATIKLTTGTTSIVLRHQNNSAGSTVNSVNTTNWQQLVKIFEATSSSNGTFQVLDNRASDRDSVQTKDIRLVDLTQWFGSTDNIPAYLLSHPEAFGRYYKGSLAYEPGRLEPATGRYLTSVRRNIWDEEWESGYFDAQGQPAVSTNYIRSKNYIEVISNTTYYFKRPTASTYIVLYDESKNVIERVSIGSSTTTYTIPGNVQFIKFAVGGSGTPVTTYNHDITISEYYSGESGYDQYYPHKVLATIDTGTEQLGAFDYKVPSGLITRLTGSVDLGTLDWVWSGDGNAYTDDLMTVVSGNNISMLGDGFVHLDRADTSGYWGGTIDKCYYFATNGRLYLRNKDSTAATFASLLSGMMLYFELAEPATEQGTPFQENVPIDDFGQLSWSDTNVPQGNQIFYPVDYKAYEDTLIKYTDGDATSIALKGELASGDPQTLKALVDYVNGKIPAAPTTNGTYDLVCTVTNGTPTYSWVART